jgi:mannose/fructose/N-acetylgalactosamine-specific phosphotransferase system component IID
MGLADSFNGLSKGAKIVVVILGLALGAYALGILGLIVMGVLANTVTGGSISVPASTSTAVTTQLTAFNSLVTTLLNPFTTIGALVIVAVLIAIFFKGRMPGSTSGVN